MEAPPTNICDVRRADTRTTMLMNTTKAIAFEMRCILDIGDGSYLSWPSASSGSTADAGTMGGRRQPSTITSRLPIGPRPRSVG